MASADAPRRAPTEELPPKALQRARAKRLPPRHRGRASQVARLSRRADERRHARSRRRAGSRSRSRTCSHVAPDAEVIDKLMPVKVALRRVRAADRSAAARSSPALGRAQLATAGARRRRRPRRVYVASDGKADYVYLRTLATGQPLARGLQEALDETIAQAADPEGDELRAAPAATTTTSSSSAPRTGCSRCTATTSSPVRRSASPPDA